MKQTKGNGINGFVRWVVGLCRSLLDDISGTVDYLCLSGQLRENVVPVLSTHFVSNILISLTTEKSDQLVTP
jgi:hypothetical protein